MGITQKIGNSGEDLVAKYITAIGYIISARNYRTRYGEIDIIAENNDKILFIEVKTRNERAKVAPREFVNHTKQKKIFTTAQIYMQKNYISLQPRFDVAEVITKDNGERTLNYIENAFGADGFGMY